MEKKTPAQKKAYAPPTVTRHGEAVEKTLGAIRCCGELRSPGMAEHVD